MAQMQESSKLEQLGAEILRKAKAESDQILAQLAAYKKEQLQQEEDRLLEEAYRKMQAEIGRIHAQSVKELSQQSMELKKQLFSQREQYLCEMTAEARERLRSFTKTPDYLPFLVRQMQSLIQNYPCSNGVLWIRPEDQTLLEGQVQLPKGWKLATDNQTVEIGGAVLEDPDRGLWVDLSLESALQAQREAFYREGEFSMEEADDSDTGK